MTKCCGAFCNQILTGFEAAERAESETERLRNLNFVVIGGGPTGVELAGAIAEIAKHSLARDFDTIDPTQASIHLIEASPRILAAFPERLAARAQSDLERLGVDVRPGLMVTGIDEQGVSLANGERIEAATKLWAAGVQASPLGRQLGVEADRSGRVVVEPDLTIAQYPRVFVAGDLAALNGTDGRQLPGVAQVAIQQGKAAAANVKRVMVGKATEPFAYKDRGNMATIGRNHAIAVIGPLKLTGFLAWLAWVLIHIVNLIGFRNRLLVMSQWIWGYVTFHRRVRLITGQSSVFSLQSSARK